MKSKSSTKFRLKAFWERGKFGTKQELYSDQLLIILQFLPEADDIVYFWRLHRGLSKEMGCYLMIYFNILYMRRVSNVKRG